MKSITTIVALIFLAITTVSCSVLALPTSQSATAGTVLFSDDFSDPNSGWDAWTQNGSSVSYQDGTLRIFVNEPQFSFWSRPGKRYDDVSIQVDATRMGGPDDNDMGILCRYKNEDNFYAFLISSDQYGGIVKVVGDEYVLLTGESLQYIDAIETGGASNTIGAVCLGTSLTLYVNGVKVASAEDGEFTTGEIGLSAGTYDIPGVDIAFDNFVATEP